ncbi:5275_t:CDS:2 [Cetraspora pellucida]|uniref:5275_t:CDS:1 n=1 Tax=Cetraspora pellucida TaxID=1433469 RepID=A0ACA9K0C8_9GLOM|nr:5275_t:CDS:2 [Cetraspora pellucida]
MTLEASIANEDRLPLIGPDIDIELQTSSDADSVNFLDVAPLQQNDEKLSFPIFDSSSNSSRTSSYKRKHSPRNSFYKQDIVNNYPSVGELFWNDGKMYSDVRLTFENREILAKCTGIPSELRLHSIVLFQSQFFKEQLSRSSSIPKNNMMNEKQIIVRLPAYISEEDIINFYCTLKLMYTKNWDSELADNLAKGVGCLSVCCEIGFHEGIEACWKWLVRKCNRDKNNEMMKLLIEAYPNLHGQFTHQVENVSSFSFGNGYTSDSNLSRNTSKRRSQRNNRPKHLCRRIDSYDSDPSNSNETTILSDTKSPKENEFITLLQQKQSSTTPSPFYQNLNNILPSPPLSSSSLPSPVLTDPTKSTSPTSTTFSTINPSLVLSHTSHPFPVLSQPPSQFNNIQLLNTWISKFESYSISSRRLCAKFPFEARDDNRCFPFIKHFSSAFESINKLGRSKHLTSPQCLDFALRVLNVIKIEHSHFHSLHTRSSKSNKDPSIVINNTTTKSLSTQENRLSSSSIILHESLDEPLSILLNKILSPVEQKHLCNYLWAPIMGEDSLVKGSRVSRVEHMVVGEKMVKVMREIISSTT